MIESERWAEVINTSLNGLYVYDVNLGQNVFVNTGYTTLTGYTSDDLQAMDKAQFFELFHPDDRQRVAEHMDRLMRGNDTLDIEYRFRTKDGRWIWCFSRDCAFARGEDGSVSQFVGTFLDITDRKQLEEEAGRLSEAAIRERDRLQALVQSISDEIWFADREGKFTLINPSGALEFALNEADEIDIKMLAAHLEIFNLDGSPRPVEESPPLRALRGEIIRNQEEIIRTPATGELRHRQVSSSPVRDKSGGIIGSVSVVRDITDLKKAEEEVRRTNRELEQRVRDRTTEIEAQYRELKELNIIIKRLSNKTIEAMESDRKALSKEIHDSIGGTLAAINLQLEARMSLMDPAARNLPSGLMPFETIVSYLKDAIREVKRISWQLRSLTLDDFGLKPAIDEHLRHFKQFYPGIEVSFQFDIADAEIPTEIQTVLYRVVQEALNNAGRHSGASLVRVELAVQQNQLRLRVTDNGCGFDLEKALAGTVSLTGYGIHSMRERVEICKGEFRIRSEPGGGTAVDVSIPL